MRALVTSTIDGGFQGIEHKNDCVYFISEASIAFEEPCGSGSQAVASERKRFTS